MSNGGRNMISMVVASLKTAIGTEKKGERVQEALGLALCFLRSQADVSWAQYLLGTFLPSSVLFNLFQEGALWTRRTHDAAWK